MLNGFKPAKDGWWVQCFPHLPSKHGSKNSLPLLSQLLYQEPASCPLSQSDYIPHTTLVSFLHLCLHRTRLSPSKRIVEGSQEELSLMGPPDSWVLLRDHPCLGKCELSSRCGMLCWRLPQCCSICFVRGSFRVREEHVFVTADISVHWVVTFLI